MPSNLRLIVVACLACTTLAPLAAAAQTDFGALVEAVLQSQSPRLYGIAAPLPEPADEEDYVPREDAVAGQRILLADGLRAEFVTRKAASLADMFAFWPGPDAYTHLIFCIEQGRSGVTPGGNDGLNVSVQRIDVATGAVATILHGMERCDGIRRTSWGTLIATEETGDGRAYEILRPLGTTGHWIADRATGDVRTAIDGIEQSDRVAQRQALPTMAWEGIGTTAEGVVIGGDELRPGDEGGLDTDGGAIFKFLPDVPWPGGVITDLEQSPLTAGRVYAMSISCYGADDEAFPQYGQGCEVGVGAWVRVDALTARSDAAGRGATGYYRPEDLHGDGAWTGKGSRFCWTNTGNEGALHFGEVVCAVDAKALPPAEPDIVDERTGLAYLANQGAYATVVANRFIEGDLRFNSVDNLGFQPGSGILYVIEDHDFGEVFACLRDGADRDVKSDGCIPMASVTDPEAEPTGFAFDTSGAVAFVSIQHGEDPEELRDFESNPVDGSTDDILKITGFRQPR